MNYSKDEFFALMDEVDAQKGEHLDEMCQMRRYDFCGDRLPERNRTLPGCGQVAMFEIPYEGSDHGPVKVCAVDDDMGRWPRFGGDRFGRAD